jgi:hypothetical protein
MRVPILFLHIVGVLTLFASLWLEAVGLRQFQRSNTVGEAAPWLALFTLVLRLYPTALGVILLTGGYLATNVGAWQFGWVRISMAALVITTIVGLIGAMRVRGLYRQTRNAGDTDDLIDRRLRSPWVTVVLGVRVAVALGILYVMVSKPYGVPSLMIILIPAALVGAMATFWVRRGAHAVGEVPRGSDSIERYPATDRRERVGSV